MTRVGYWWCGVTHTARTGVRVINCSSASTLSPCVINGNGQDFRTVALERFPRVPVAKCLHNDYIARLDEHTCSEVQTHLASPRDENIFCLRSETAVRREHIGQCGSQARMTVRIGIAQHRPRTLA